MAKKNKKEKAPLKWTTFQVVAYSLIAVIIGFFIGAGLAQ